LKIGIVTFHWGTNYGGVLQSFALQAFLERQGFEVQIINFAPKSFRDSFLRCFKARKSKTVFSNIKNYIKEKNIDKFRKKHLNLTPRYSLLNEVKANTLSFECLITGSDQVWNPYGIQTHGLVYFLPFAGAKTIRLSYAASFGCVNYPKDVMKKIKPLITKFNAISVREKSGLDILSKEGFNDLKLMPDPTLLLDKVDYINLMGPNKSSKTKYGFFYTLQPNQKIMDTIYKGVSKKIKTISTLNLQSSTMGIEEWIRTIYNAEFVVTNSFHGVIFSLLLNKNFIVVPIEGALVGMNDRVYTLLDRFNLRDRLIESYDETVVFQEINRPINWEYIQKVQKELQEEASCFFFDNLSAN
jgi:hypothetical protein